MKKNLLLSSALVAAGLFVAGDAFAQAKPMTLSVGGYWHLYYNYTSQDNNGPTAAGALGQGGFQRVRDASYNDGEIFFRGSTTLDNGLQVGFQVEYEMDNQQDQVDEVFMDLRGSFGRVVLGQFDPAAREMQRVAPSGSRSYLNGVNEMGWQNNPLTGTPDFSTTSTFNAGDAEKIVYFSPVFSGFQAGVSYAPNGAESAVAAGAANTGGLNNSWLPSSIVGNGDTWDAMVTYAGKFGDFGVAAGLGYQWQDVQGTLGVYRNAANAVQQRAVDPVQTYLGHLIFTLGGFEFGGTFAVYEIDVKNPLAGERSSLTNLHYDLGVSYTTGPWKVGVSWMRVEDETGADNIGGTNATFQGEYQADKYLLNASYLLGPGISIESGLAYEKYQFTGVQPDQKGTTFFVGTRLGF